MKKARHSAPQYSRIMQFSMLHSTIQCRQARNSALHACARFRFQNEKHIEVQEFHEVEIFSTVQRTHVEIRSLLPPSDSISKSFPLSQFVRLRKYGWPKVPTYSTEYVHQRTRTYPTSYLSHKTPRKTWHRTYEYVCITEADLVTHPTFLLSYIGVRSCEHGESISFF